MNDINAVPFVTFYNASGGQDRMSYDFIKKYVNITFVQLKSKVVDSDRGKDLENFYTHQ